MCVCVSEIRRGGGGGLMGDAGVTVDLAAAGYLQEFTTPINQTPLSPGGRQ